MYQFFYEFHIYREYKGHIDTGVTWRDLEIIFLLWLWGMRGSGSLHLQSRCFDISDTNTIK